MLKRVIPVTVVALLLTVLTVAPALALLQTGQQAPDFQLADLSNTMHSLSDYRGKVVVIDFFGADCIPCKTSATNDLVPLYNNYYRDDARVQFLSVEVTGVSAAYTNSNFVQPTGITWPVLVGGTSLVSSYGITTTPTVYVIDSTGKVALAMPYPINVQTLKSTIDQYAGSGQGWRAWEDVGGQLLPGTGPAVSSWGSGRLDVFVEGMDNQLWHKSYLNGWSGWEPLGGVLTSSPAAASRASGIIDVVVRGTDGALWQREYNNGWQSWTPLGGIIYPGTGPAASSWGSGRLDVFVEGMDHAVWHKYWQNGWSGWEPLGGVLTSSPAAASPASGKIDVFVRGTDGAAWQREYSNNGWQSWTPLGGIIYPGTAPAASSWGSGRLDVFVEGMDLALWHQGNSGTWSGWEPLGGTLTSSPAAASPASGTIDVFVRGTDGAPWQREYSSG